MHPIKKLIIFNFFIIMPGHDMQQIVGAQQESRVSLLSRKNRCNQINKCSFYCGAGSFIAALACNANPFCTIAFGIAQTYSCCLTALSTAKICFINYKLKNLSEEPTALELQGLNTPIPPAPQDQTMV